VKAGAVVLQPMPLGTVEAAARIASQAGVQ
jgi:hypothetical protein